MLYPYRSTRHLVFSVLLTFFVAFILVAISNQYVVYEISTHNASGRLRFASDRKVRVDWPDALASWLLAG